MYLKEDTDVTKFLTAVSHCEGDVHFCTKDGDRLNLKSELMRFVFVAQMRNQVFLYESSIELMKTSDFPTIADYVRPANREA